LNVSSHIPLEDFGGIPVRSSRPIATTAGADSVITSPITHPTGFTWNFFGGIKVDDKERKTTERRKTANDDHGSLPQPLATVEDSAAPTSVNSGRKFVSPPKPEKGRSAEFGGEVDEAGYAVVIPERSDLISSSLPTTSRPTVVVPTPTPALSTSTSAATTPKSQPEHETLNQTNDNSHSDSSSSISVSFPVFAHSPNESDLDDENSNPRDGATSAMSGIRKGYRYGEYVQAQMKLRMRVGMNNVLLRRQRKRKRIVNWEMLSKLDEKERSEIKMKNVRDDRIGYG
jgi:hypothetical protein